MVSVTPALMQFHYVAQITTGTIVTSEIANLGIKWCQLFYGAPMRKVTLQIQWQGVFWQMSHSESIRE